jgi:hypothetical protein
MPGPTAEVLNEEVKGLRDDLHKVEGSLRQDIHQLDIRVAKLSTEFGVVKWVVGATLVATLSGIGSGIWWAATVTADVKNLGSKIDERFKVVDERFKTIDARFDRLEASIAKVIEQTRPASKP